MLLKLSFGIAWLTLAPGSNAHAESPSTSSVVPVTRSVNFTTSNWKGQFAAGSGVLESISPASDPDFTFSPTDYFSLRNASGNYHTGDINIRWRLQGQEWQDISSAVTRDPSPMSYVGKGSLLFSDYSNVWPDVAQYMNITRQWKGAHGDLILSATIANTGNSTFEIGGFGFPIEMNNIFWNRSPEEVTAMCVVVDPNIGNGGGYAQVTRLTGTGPNMVITPYGGNNASRLEAWRQIPEDISQPCGYQTVEFEGVQAWQTLSLGYAENEWSQSEPWNTATSAILTPGQQIAFALRFSIAPQVFDIEDTVAKAGVPVAVGIPGYILPSDLTGKLYLRYTYKVQSITTEPAGALSFASIKVPNRSIQAYNVNVLSGAFGRIRVTIQYADGTSHTIQYLATQSGPTLAENFGSFLFNQQWFNDSSDPFHRSPSVMSYDNEAQALILQEYRAWIAGVADDAGSGPFEAAALKSSIYPVSTEVQQLEEMVDGTVWGWLQDNNSLGYNTEYGVKRSLFFYEPSAVPGYNYTPEAAAAWDRSEAYQVWRSYDYVHVSALYWGLYRAERSSPGVLQMQPASWYLLQAYQTAAEISASYPNGTAVVGYTDVGLMCETIWVYLLNDLRAENYTAQANTLEANMKARQQIWATSPSPFGSEQPWDSTGQEGVAAWSRYFNDNATVTETLNSIRGYDPTVAHWGYNGNARRYWDFTTAGKIAQIERMIHHYGSALNALPMLEAYYNNMFPSSPSALYDLRVGYGGNMGGMANHQQNGFASVAFHSYPDLLEWDAYSGDHGLGFLGHVIGACTILVQSPDYGWISFGGNVQTAGNTITVLPRDTVRRRIFVAARGLFVEFDAGQITNFQYNTKTGGVQIKLAPVSGASAKNATMIYQSLHGQNVSLQSKTLGNQLNGVAVPISGTIQFQ